ncbi:MAG: ADP-glyceromanno-heptose 6-epimerase [Polyangiaceae bacterium]
MIIVTGGAGFIGSNIVRTLNERGERNVIVVDNLTRAEKIRNLADCVVADYWDKQEFLAELRSPRLTDVRAIIDQGACSDTTEANGRYLMENNHSYSKAVLGYAQELGVPLVYASSAAVYGLSEECREDESLERPLNAYGYSKLVFDQYLRGMSGKLRTPVVGLRYFNVYGPREAHKGRMASVALHFFRQLRDHGVCRLFGAYGGRGDGEHSRDFVSVEDVVKVVLHFTTRAPKGLSIVNVGTGESRSYNDLAKTLIGLLGRGVVEYMPFPQDLTGKYQCLTRADLTLLRQCGYHDPFLSLEEGLKRYVDVLRHE